MKTKLLKFLLLSVLLTSCGVQQDELEELYLDISISSGEVAYNEEFSVSWESNGSQCYGEGYWSGEKALSGTESFAIKRRGIFNFLMECRRNNEFINRGVAVDVSKSVKEHFIYAAQSEPNLSISFPASEKASISSVTRGDFNGDFNGDAVFAVEFKDKNDSSFKSTKYFQVIGGPAPYIEELLIEGCQASAQMISADINNDTFWDVLIGSNDSLSSDRTHQLCILSGAELVGLSQNFDLITNETNFDLNSTKIRLMGKIDRSADAVPDFYILGDTSEYWIVAGAADGPSFEAIEYDNTNVKDLTLSSLTVFDFDNNANQDLVLSGYDANNQGVFVTVPRTSGLSSWDGTTVYQNQILAKEITTINFDNDVNPDMFVIGDEKPLDLFNLSNTNTLAHFETGEVNIFDNRTDVSFTRSGSSNINKNLLIADYDQDLDGGDIILTFNNFGANSANFIILEKQQSQDDEGNTVFEFKAFDDLELGIENLPFQNQQSVFIDLDIDSDLDVVFMKTSEESEDNKLEFFLKINSSN